MGIRDVIVVGAGPGGATAATALAQKGYDVLLLDRAPFPRDKTCGDAVPAGAINILNGLGMTQKIEAAAERGEFYPVHSMRLLSPRRIKVETAFEYEEGSQTYVAPRLYFDALVQQHAIDSGAEFQVGQVKEPIVENGRVVGVQARLNGSTAALRARMVIGADGVTSSIARHLRPDSHLDNHRAVALRAYIEDLETFANEVEFYLYNEILPGYAWIFPLGNNRANIGLGMRLDILRHKNHDLKKMLDDFLAMPEINSRLLNGGQLTGVKTWQLNFGSQKNVQRAYDGALLVGDAAGFIDPLTGGGIYNAIISAEIAADVIDHALKRGDTSREGLRQYEARCDAELWHGFRRSFNIQRGLLRFPFLVDFLSWSMQANSSFAQTFLSKL